MRLPIPLLVAAAFLGCNRTAPEPNASPATIAVPAASAQAQSNPNADSARGLIYDVETDCELQARRDEAVNLAARAIASAFGLPAGPALGDFAALDDRVALTRDGYEGFRVRALRRAELPTIERALRQALALPWMIQRQDDLFVVRLSADAVALTRSQAVDRTVEVISRRLRALGVQGNAKLVGGRLVVEIGATDSGRVDQLQSVLSSQGRVEFHLVDDDVDLLASAMRSWQERAIPLWVAWSPEVVGAANSARRTIFMASTRRRGDETMANALLRLQSVISEVDLGALRTVAYARVQEHVPGASAPVGTGWRTYVVRTNAELTGADTVDANAQIDHDSWSISLKFTDSAAKHFEMVTGTNVGRRLAIMSDGVVESAPLIMNAIAGGRATLTMGAGTGGEAEARRLELMLRTGALPAALVRRN